VSPTRPRRLLPLAIALALSLLPLLSFAPRLAPVGSVSAPVFLAVVALAVVLGSVAAVVVAVAFALLAVGASRSRGRRRVV